jgi:glycosyltransferase 2 family protein
MPGASGTAELTSQSNREKPERSRILLILGYGLATVCLIWVLHDFHIVRALHDMANANWKWVLVGMAFDVISYAVQAVRWKFLLSPFGKVHLGKATRSVFSGLFANLILPLRPGEFLRSYLLSNSEGISIGRVLGSVGIERFIDLVIATASLAFVSLFVELPRRFERTADVLGAVTLVLVTIVVVLVLYLELKVGGASEPHLGRRHLPGKVMSALLDLHAMGTAPSFYAAVFMSLLMPFCQVLALWALTKSYGLQSQGHPLSFMASVVVLLVINLGVSLPNAPANVGSYQLFCILGLGVFDVEKTAAIGFSFFAFIALTLPFVFLGFAALLSSGMSLRSMREITRLRRRRTEAPASD